MAISNEKLVRVVFFSSNCVFSALSSIYLRITGVGHNLHAF
jgi:hypothetical protein